jgi:hypothetical protein
MKPLVVKPHIINGLPQISTQEEDIKLIHDERLTSSFLSGRIETLNPSENMWCGKLNLKITSPLAETILKVDKEIITQNREYYANPDFLSRHIFNRPDYKLDKEDTEILVGGDVAQFVHYTNILFNEFYRPEFFNTIYLQLEDGSINAINEKFEVTYWIYPLGGKLSKEEIIKGIKTELKWIPIRLGMGIEAPGLQTRVYSNGSDHFVNHATLGRVPGGLYYLDLMNWDGQNQDFQLGHIKHTG